MDGTVIVLVLILIVLWSIKKALDNIAWRIIQTSTSIENKTFIQTSTTDLSKVEHQLKNIYKILGGEEKMKEGRLKRYKENYSLLVKALVLSGKTPKQAEEEASKYLEEKQFDETLGGDDYSDLMHYSRPDKAMSALRWAHAQFIEDRNKKNYSHLLPKAREYLHGKTTVNLSDIQFKGELAKTFKIDYEGGDWLITKLIQENRLKAITEWSSDGTHKDVLRYEVLETAK